MRVAEDVSPLELADYSRRRGWAAPPADPEAYPDAYHASWLQFLVAPEWSYRLNADFEDHADHEYIGYVAGHPELEARPDPGSYAAEYWRYGSVADLLRQIGHDERIHKLDSLANIRAPRFGPAADSRIWQPSAGRPV